MVKQRIRILSVGGTPAAAVAVVCALVASFVLTVLAGRAEAATFTVNKTADTNDGSCTPSDCSLREAVIAANSSVGADVVTVPAGTYTLSIAGRDENAAATGDLDVTDDLTISGTGARSTIVDGGGIDRVFDVIGSTAVMSGLTIQGGETTGFGGGIEIRSRGGTSGDRPGNLSLTDSTVWKNVAPGGGIHVARRGFSLPVGNSLTLQRSTVAANTAGSGIYVNRAASISLENSTVSSNAGNGLSGEGGHMILSSTTVAFNGGSGLWGAPPNGAVASAEVKNTIVAQNSGGNCAGVQIDRAGPNLEFPGTSCGFSVTGDPKLGPLKNNGGPTDTHALGSGSAAIDAGGGCLPPATDQRGGDRPQDGDANGSAVCDIGSFELGAAPSTPRPSPGTSETATSFAGAGGTVSTDDEGDGATASDPVETSVTTPNRGPVSIEETSNMTQSPPSGFSFFGQQVNITAPAATPNSPLRIVFTLDSAIVPSGTVEVFKNGSPVADCTGAPGTASPDPCVSSRTTVSGGDLQITVLTSTASDWNFGTTTAPSDTTPPTTTASTSPRPNAAGWNNTNVAVTLSAEDNSGGSGVDTTYYSVDNASCSPNNVGSCNTYTGTFTITTEGIHTVRFFSKDKAGNFEQVKTLIVRVDKTAPSVSCSATPSTLWPPNHKLRSVATTVSVSDALSGPAGFKLTSTASNEPDSRAFPADVPGDIRGWTTGTADTSGQLRAERDPKGRGRVYTLRYTGFDVAGSSTTCDALVSVPHDRSG